MNNSEFRSFNVYIDNETLSISEYLGKGDNGVAQRKILFKSPRSFYDASTIASIFENILREF